MTFINLELISISGASEIIDFRPSSLIIAGWTGRNPSAVHRHIDELGLLGIKPPVQVPMLYFAGKGLLTCDDVIEVVGNHSSGEVEFCLLSIAGAVYVTVGSDHTDRQLEISSIPLSKQVCPKPISVRCWKLDEIIEHWDELRLRSYVGEASTERLYQDGSVSEILHPNELMSRAFTVEPNRNGQILNGQIVFSGTVPTIGPIQPAKSFRAELIDPVLRRSLICSYTTKYLRD